MSHLSLVFGVKVDGPGKRVGIHSRQLSMFRLRDPFWAPIFCLDLMPELISALQMHAIIGLSYLHSNIVHGDLCGVSAVHHGHSLFIPFSGLAQYPHQ
jgi:hypothetical protein